MKDTLEHNANTIEYVLHQHGIEGRVDGGTVSPRLFSFNLALPPQVKASRIASLTGAVAAALGVVSCRLSQHEGKLTLEVPRPDPSTVRLLPLYQKLQENGLDDGEEVPTSTCLLGLDTEGTPLLLRLDGEGVGNALLLGQGGSGKSQLLRAMLGTLALANAPTELQMLLVDAGQRAANLRPFDGLPHLLRPVLSDPLDAVHHLNWLARHVEYREENDGNYPTIVVAIDDAAPLLKADARKFGQALSLLCQRGPDVGIHVLVASRRADDTLMGDNLHSNFNTRLVAQVASSEDARLAVGSGNSGAEKLLGLGDMLVVLNGELVRLQAAIISDNECRQLVGLMQKCAREQEREKQPGRGDLRPRDLSTRRRTVATAPTSSDEDEEMEANVTRLRRNPGSNLRAATK